MAKAWVWIALTLLAAVPSIGAATLSDVNAILPGSAATYSHLACQIKPSGQPACDSDFKLISGSESGWPCFAATVALEPSEIGAGGCKMSSSGATVHVRSPSCESFHTVMTGGQMTFEDQSGRTWSVESFVIKAGRYRHTISGDDRWSLIPFSQSELDGSRIAVVRGGRRMTVVLRGQIWSSSFCAGEPIPVEPSAFGFDLHGRWIGS